MKLHENIRKKLEGFTLSKKIPHIIFHGASGSGKRTIVFEFLRKIYNNDKAIMKSNIMFVNCAHGGKGIKFIREDLKFFAKTNIKYNRGVIFKTVVLQNADFLTNDAQSALRRCIEEYSNSTRFFIIVENKNKLLNPILSRFCEIYFPAYLDTSMVDTPPINLHQYHLLDKPSLHTIQQGKMKMISNAFHSEFREKLENINRLYSAGISGLDIVEWIQSTEHMDTMKKTSVVMLFHKVKHEFRCEKLLILYLFNCMAYESDRMDALLEL